MPVILIVATPVNLLRATATTCLCTENVKTGQDSKRIHKGQSYDMVTLIITPPRVCEMSERALTTDAEGDVQRCRRYRPESVA